MYLCFVGIDCTRIICSCKRPAIAAIIGSKDSTSLFFIKKFSFYKYFFCLGTQYFDRFIQQFSPKEKITLEIIKDLHILIDEISSEFSNHNSRLPNKLVFYRSSWYR
jgi:hypothetical protein